MSLTSCPQEIVNIIVEGVVQEHGKLDAKRCALISRAFLPRCQEYLWEKISLGGSQRVERIKELGIILQRRPSLGEYVKYLHFALDEDNAWISDDPTFLDCMKSMFQFARPPLSLCIEGSPQARLANPGGFFKYFIEPFISPTVTTLRLQRLENVPLASIEACINLEELCLIVVHLSTEQEDLQTPSLNPVIVRKLEYGGSDATIQALGLGEYTDPSIPPRIDLSSLSELKADIDQSEVPTLARIIEASSSSLQKLYLHTEDGDIPRRVSLTGQINLQHVHKLQLLEIDIVLGRKEQRRTALDGIISILRSIPEDNFLSELTLRVWVGLGANVFPSDCFEANWSQMGAQIGRVSGGKKIKLSLELKYWLPPQFAAFYPPSNFITHLLPHERHEFDRLAQVIVQASGGDSVVGIGLEVVVFLERLIRAEAGRQTPGPL